MNGKITTTSLHSRTERLSTVKVKTRKGQVLVLAAVLIFIQINAAPTTNAQLAETNHRTAQLMQGQNLTLPLAVEIALRTNPLIRATQSRRDMADSQLSEAQSSRLPLVQFSEILTRSNNPVFVFGSLLEQGKFGSQNFDPNFLNNPDSLTNSRTAMSFRMPVYDQRQSDSRIKQAHIGQQQADKQAEMVRQQIRFEVLRAYYGLLVVRARKEVSDEAIKMAEADVARISERFKAGMVVQSDLLAAEVQLAEYRQQQIQNDGEIIIAEAALNTALGLSVDTPAQVAGELIEKNFVIPDQPELIKLAIANRPEFAHANLSLKSAEERARAISKESLPRLDLFGSVGLSSNGINSGSSDYTVGASLTLNIFDAGRKERLNQARIQEDLAATEQERLANQIRFEVIQAYRRYVSARERVSVAAGSINQAKESLRITQARYREGLTTITDMLRAETDLVRARINLIAARYDQYIGFAGVLLATGRLTDVQSFV